MKEIVTCDDFLNRSAQITHLTYSSGKEEVIIIRGQFLFNGNDYVTRNLSYNVFKTLTSESAIRLNRLIYNAGWKKSIYYDYIEDEMTLIRDYVYDPPIQTINDKFVFTPFNIWR